MRQPPVPGAWPEERPASLSLAPEGLASGSGASGSGASEGLASGSGASGSGASEGLAPGGPASGSVTAPGPVGRVRRAAVAAAAALALAAAGLPAGAAGAAGQPEPTPTGADPALRGTDLYAFVSPDRHGTVTLIADWRPFEEPTAGSDPPAFSAGAHYDINVDNDGDARPDVTYRWVFANIPAGAAPVSDAAPGNASERDGGTPPPTGGPVDSLDDPVAPSGQTYTLTEIRDGRSTTLLKDAVAAPSGAGRAAFPRAASLPTAAPAAAMPDYAALRRQAITPLKGGGQSFAGQADDPSFLDLRLLHGGDLSERGRDELAGYDVLATALQVPARDLAENGDPDKNPVIGVWSSASRPSDQAGRKAAGGMEQVSRMGNPLVARVFAAGSADAFRTSTPDRDAQNKALIAGVTDPGLPRLFGSTYRIPAPAAPRNDLVEIFLTGVAKDAPTLDGTVAPIRADLTSQILNRQAQRSAFVPSEQLRLNLSVPVTARPERLGVLAGDDQGFPNGRRLTDDVVDIELRLLEGAGQTGRRVSRLVAGDGVDGNDVPFGATFPYLALPHRPAR